MTVRINERFKPDPSFKTLQYIYLLIIILFLLPFAMLIIIPVSSYPRFAVITISIFLAVCLLILIPSVIWINLYYSTIFYTFTEDEIIVEKGIWWKRKSIVPYNRITNIDMHQGPISRILSLWELRIQTAGYHAAPGSAVVAEAVLQGIKNVEELRGFILNMVRRLRPVAVEADAEAVPPRLDEQILAELKKIREILESKS